MAESQEVDIVANVHNVISITTNAPNDTVTLPIMPTPSGTQVKNDLTVTVSTNNSTGYSLSMNSETTNTSLVHKMATGIPPTPNIPSTTHAYNAPATLPINSWGWGLGAAAATTNFSKIPPSDDSQTISATIDPSGSSDTAVTFAAHIADTTVSGSYTNTIVFTATANPTPQTIRITNVSPSTNWSGGDIYLTGANFPITDVGTTITVGGTLCASYRLIDDNNAICVLPDKLTGGTYPVVMTSAALGQSNTNRTVTYDGVNKGNMQNFSSTACQNMPMGLAQIWTDARNNAVYRIKKMLDNKCWMIDNLAYAGGTSNGGTDFYGDIPETMTFSTACGTTTYNTSSTPTNCIGPTAWGSSRNTRRVTTNNFTGNNLTDRMGNPIQGTEGNLHDASDNAAPCTNSPTGSDDMRSECLSYLYSWCAAIGLGSATTPTCEEVREDSTTSDSDGSTSADEIPNNNMAGPGIVGKPGGIGGESKGNSQAANQAGVATTNGSICPAGWRLPVGRVGSSSTGTNVYNEFAILSGAMYTVGQDLSPSIITSTNRAVNWYPVGSFSAVGSGRFVYNTGLGYQSYHAQYWGSSLLSNTDAVFSQLRPDYIAPGASNTTKNVGMAVRCVLN